MSSTNTTSPSQETTQPGDPSARLSLAILKLDQLIIRVGNLEDYADPLKTNTTPIWVAPKDTETPDTLLCDTQPTECRDHELHHPTRLSSILSNLD